MRQQAIACLAGAVLCAVSDLLPAHAAAVRLAEPQRDHRVGKLVRRCGRWRRVTLTPPRACASRSAGGARSCGCAASSPRRRRRAAPRSPSALRAVTDAPAALARRTSSCAPGRDHRVDPGVDLRVQLLALHHQPDQQRRPAHRGRSTAPTRRRAARARRRRAARARARSAGGRPAGSRPPPRARAARGRRVARPGPRCSSSASQRSRTPSGGGGRRLSSVSAARRYRPVPPTTIGRSAGVEQRVDLGVGELRVLAGAELRVDGQERDQPMLELRPARAGPAAPVRISSPA